MLKIKIHPASEGSELALSQKEDKWYIDQQLFDGDIAKLSDDTYHVIWNDQSFNISVLEANYTDKSFSFLINGVKYQTQAQDEFDLLKEKLGFTNHTSQKLNNIKAPMPGLIQSVHVQAGDEVHQGETLVVLVAMKMENAIKAIGSGTVKFVHISPDQSVEKGQVIIEFI